MSEALAHANIYTEEDYYNLPENVRAELIDGQIYYMAAPSRIHQKILMFLSKTIANYIDSKDGSCEVYPAPFAVKLFEDDDKTVVEPDISVVCDMDKLDEIGCKGVPDLVMEILSPSTTRHDRFTKFNLYWRAGVREYWIVNPASKSVQVFVLDGGHYVAKDFGAAGDKIKVNVLEDCSIDLSQVFPE